jgi:hypothetical protein
LLDGNAGGAKYKRDRYYQYLMVSAFCLPTPGYKMVYISGYQNLLFLFPIENRD